MIHYINYAQLYRSLSIVEPVPQTIAQSYIPINNDTAYPTPTLDQSPYSISLTSTLILLINILGFIWIIGVLFQLSRLVYGLIVVKRFKGSLEPVKDASFNNMLIILRYIYSKGRLVPQALPLIPDKVPMAIGLYTLLSVSRESSLPH